jgi:hypothetical protein
MTDPTAQSPKIAAQFDRDRPELAEQSKAAQPEKVAEPPVKASCQATDRTLD